MLSDKTEKKRMVSSMFIILAPPRRGCTGPAKAPLYLPTEKPVPRKEGRGPGSAPGAGEAPCRPSDGLPSPRGGGRSGRTQIPLSSFSPADPTALQPPPGDPPQPSVEAVLGSLQPTALQVETLGPDLPTGAAALPSSLQVILFRICAFCHKGISPGALALEAMRKQYHVRCFTCRVCHSSLAGERYYQKEGRPLCVACYQTTLEKCDACQASILSEIVWAVGKGYHPECFTCVDCSRQIGSDAFAVDDEQRALCLPDFYRRFAPVCGVCEEPIIPQDGRDAYRIECLGRSFHEDCYRCEKCQVLLSLEPTEDGCYPLGSRLLCQACHAWQIQCPPGGVGGC
uniref:Filamin binding LIM protein 1 n=1 Tax=Pseudonaja textilis TaxID=8673 RepID=A0A670ZUS8_PSETE